MRDLIEMRASMLMEARRFFSERKILEVDTSLLQKTACVDAHIDLFSCTMHGKPWYLHSSPEYAMKKMLAKGAGDIYQLSHVFRKEELGTLHRPEFMMAEWYRIDESFDIMIEETLAFITLIAGERQVRHLTYQEAFLEFLSIDPFAASEEELLAVLPKEMHHEELLSEGRDGILNLLLATQIEPLLGIDEYTTLSYYPKSQAALSKVTEINGIAVAERFEVYANGVELANGYHELTDSKEQKIRLEEANQKRIEMDKCPLPIDKEFISALEHGLPDCCGVAVGFDRLLMLRMNSNSISEVLYS